MTVSHLILAKTFLEEIKEAAESAQNETDFIYEPTSGLYYDQKTGYYYNAVSPGNGWKLLVQIFTLDPL